MEAKTIVAMNTIPPHSPVLGKLALGQQELEALGKQGQVVREERRPGQVYFRLKFRVGGRQRSKYLGADAAVAAQCEAEISELQAALRLNRKLVHLGRESSQLLMEIKAKLSPLLAGRGFSWHGRTIRKKR